MLEPYRVLDLTDEKGLFCGKLLGDLGAEVIKIEKPGGDKARDIGSFYHDEAHPEKSLFWLAHNINKKSVTLNIEHNIGKEIFRRLIKTADFVVESFAPGYMDKLGLGYSVLSRDSSGLIMASITAFGQDGPYKDYKANDIVVMALGGILYICGDPDRPPVKFSLPQAFLHAAVDAATGMLVALFHRQSTGEGQYIDVSAQESIIIASTSAHHVYDLEGENVRRWGPRRYRPGTGVIQRESWPCKDGHVAFFIMGGRMGAQFSQRLAELLEEEGLANEFYRTADWPNLDFSDMTQEKMDMLEEPLGKYFLSHTKEEIAKMSLERRQLILPGNTIKDISESPQLLAREFWEVLEYPELGDAITYPGAFDKYLP